MSSTTTEPILPARLIQVLANPFFPALDSSLRTGRHINQDDLDYHTLLMDFQEELTSFYLRYHVDLIRAPEGFFYLRPRSTTLMARAVLSELEMLVGKVLCYLYLSPERLNQQGVFSQQDLYQELFTLVDQSRLLKLVNHRATGSDRDCQKVLEKVNSALNRLRRLGMVVTVGRNYHFRITEAVFRFAADVRGGEEAHVAQRRLVRSGEAIIPVPLKLVSMPDDLDNPGTGLDNDEPQATDNGDVAAPIWDQT